MNAGKFVKHIFTEDTGGGCYVDFLELSDGRIIGINEECAVLYKNIDQVFEGGHEQSFSLLETKT
jgi:hypothetical protein